MPNSPPVYYWDSCVLLAWVKEEQDRVSDVQGLLDDAKKGHADILTSMVSIVEVSNGVTQASGQRDLAMERKIDALWRPPYPVQLIEFFPAVAFRARDLMRFAVDVTRKLTPLDAVHLATAEHMGATIVHTYDPVWAQWSGDINIPVQAPQAPRPPML